MRQYRQLLFWIILIICVSKQNAQDQAITDSLPMWISQPNNQTATLSDTLKLFEPVQTPKGVLIQRWMGIGIMSIAGILAYNFRQQANSAYADYVRSGQIEVMNDLFSKTERLDGYSGMSYIVVEVGFLLFVSSFKDPE